MTARYGRNQRRRARERIAELERQVAENAASARKLEDMTRRLNEMASHGAHMHRIAIAESRGRQTMSVVMAGVQNATALQILSPL